jgi:predicted nucleic-acid-binding Zn-ribbon protein
MKNDNAEFSKNKWICPKCNTSSDVLDKRDKNRYRDAISKAHSSEIVSMTSGGFSKFFNVQNQKFLVLTCVNCTYSEFYRSEVKAWESIIDFFGN